MPSTREEGSDIVSESFYASEAVLHKKQKDLKNHDGISMLDEKFKHLLTAALCGYFLF